jgi:hypothetical protein
VWPSAPERSQGGWGDAPGLSPAAAFPHRNFGIGTTGMLPGHVAVCIWQLLKNATIALTRTSLRRFNRKILI